MKNAQFKDQPIERWRSKDGDWISCLEKIKVLNENHDEIQSMMQDHFEDALLMGCDDAHLRDYFHNLVDRLVNPYE